MTKQLDWLKEHEKITGKKYGKTLPFYENKKQLENIEKFIPKKCKKICDLGCGSGIVGSYIKYKRPKTSLIFVDANKKQLSGIKERYSQKICVDLLKYSPKNKFDCVVSRLVNHYFEKKDQLKILKKVKNILNKKGTYFCIIPLAKNFDEQKGINKFFFKLERMITKDKAIKRHILTKKEIRKLSNKAGFKKTIIHKNSNIEHTMQQFYKKFKLNKKQIKEFNYFIKNLTKLERKRLHLKKKGNKFLISYPSYVVEMRK